MSNDVFPVLPGVAFDSKRIPVWSTKVHKSVSGKQLRAALWSYPIWKYSLSFELLRAGIGYAEFQALCGFFVKHQGAFDSWLYSDPSDNAVTGQAIGTGNGVTTSFQLVRSFGSGSNVFAEPMQAINGAPVIRVAGVVKTAGTDYSVSATGLVTFGTAPASGASITADFAYYFRCHFLNDELEFNQFMYQLWEAQTVEFETLK